MMEETEEMKRCEVQNRAIVTLYRKKTFTMIKFCDISFL